LQQAFGSQMPVSDSHTGNGDAFLPLAYFLCYYPQFGTAVTFLFALMTNV